LKLLLESVVAQTNPDFILWHLDNGSKPDEAMKIKTILAEFSKLINIKSFWGEKNIGFAGGHEFLFSQHQADYTMLLNDDAILESDYTQTLVEFLDKNPQTGAVSGLVYRWLWNADQTQPRKTTLIDTAGLKKTFYHKVYDFDQGREISQTKIDLKNPYQVFAVSGCLPIYRSSAVKNNDCEYDLFDPKYMIYKEDIDLGYRLEKLGFTAWTVPTATAYHMRYFKKKRWWNRGISYNAEYWSYRNHWYNLIKHVDKKDWRKNPDFVKELVQNQGDSTLF
jgi:GT2 family glycosyltransferase